MMPTDPAQVSLYIPCFNAEKHIKRTLESVFSQSHPISQVLVVDDGSTDQTLKILESLPVEVIRHPENLGITRTRNTALEHVREEFVASVDADVVLEPEWLEKIMANFSDGAVGGVGGRTIETNTESLVGQWLVAHRSPDGGEERKYRPSLPAGAVVYRRNALMEIGGYNDDKRYDHSDLDASMRVIQIGYLLAYEPEAVCYHHFQGDVRSLFDGMWRFKKDAFVNCGLFANPFGLRRKIKINLGEFHQMLMDDFHAGRHDSMHLNIVGTLRHSLLDIRLYHQLHPEGDRRVHAETLEALKIGLQYLFCQKENISPPLAAILLSHVLDVLADARGQDGPPELFEKSSDEDLKSHIKGKLPKADLNRVSDWLVMFLGFLNSFPPEVWKQMDEVAV